jgi:tetratricopeptide (TPR) repeat protein
LLLQKGEVTASIDLYKNSIQTDPYYTPGYLALARVYVLLKDRKSALEILDRLLKLDPGDDAARQERLKVSAIPDESPKPVVQCCLCDWLWKRSTKKTGAGSIDLRARGKFKTEILLDSFKLIFRQSFLSIRCGVLYPCLPSTP